MVLCGIRHSGKRVNIAKWEMKTRHNTPYHSTWLDTICQSDVITQSWWIFFVVVWGDAPRIFNFFYRCDNTCMHMYTWHTHISHTSCGAIVLWTRWTLISQKLFVNSRDAYRRIKLNGHTFVTKWTIEKRRHRAPFKIGGQTNGWQKGERIGSTIVSFEKKQQSRNRSGDFLILENMCNESRAIYLLWLVLLLLFFFPSLFSVFIRFSLFVTCVLLVYLCLEYLQMKFVSHKSRERENTWTFEISSWNGTALHSIASSRFMMMNQCWMHEWALKHTRTPKRMCVFKHTLQSATALRCNEMMVHRIKWAAEFCFVFLLKRKQKLNANEWKWNVTAIAED